MNRDGQGQASRCKSLAWALCASLLAIMPATARAGFWPTEVAGSPMPSLAPMLEKVMPSVVNIHTSTRLQVSDHPLLSDPLFRNFFDLPNARTQPREQIQRSLGSGVLMDAAKGYVLTNNHVIKDAQEITITLMDGRNLQAQKVGQDSETDIAVVRIPAERLTALDIGDSDALRVGDFVVAIGNPFGLGSTVTSGIVSAMGRNGLGIEGYEDFIQTDASINPGNSGGALVNLRGELVGINTAILAKGGGNVGIGFAIPVNMVRKIMAQLIDNGEVRRGLLGVQSQDLTPDLATAFGLDRVGGAVVGNVVSDSGAAKAGLRRGDVIIEVNGREVRNAASLRNMIGLVRMGDEVQIKYMRDGKIHEAKAVVSMPEVLRMEGKTANPLLDGALLAIKPGKNEENESILVATVREGSPAWRIGLRPEDHILSVNRQVVKSFEDLTTAAARSHRQLLLNIERGGQGMFILVR
ncbi:MAG: DegQ family serine endoprotease [Magnetococcales bacterium]|nr:DegQ family serine endoprotease [Magnetococcales bacterium]MBF0321472.1 DegQ family serine endoprotease [Magnetococcales bacterium]